MRDAARAPGGGPRCPVRYGPARWDHGVHHQQTGPGGPRARLRPPQPAPHRHHRRQRAVAAVPAACGAHRRQRPGRPHDHVRPRRARRAAAASDGAPTSSLLHRAVVPGPGTFYDHASRLYLLVEPGRLHWEREDRPDWWPVHPVSVPNHPFAVALKELMGIPADEAAWPTTGTLAVYVFSELFPEAELRFTGTTVAERDRPDRVHARLGPGRRGHPRAPPRRGGRAPSQVGGAGPDRAGRVNVAYRAGHPASPAPAQHPDPHRQRRARRRGARRAARCRRSPAELRAAHGREAAVQHGLRDELRRDHERRTDELDDQLRRISGQLVALEQRVADLERPAGRPRRRRRRPAAPRVPSSTRCASNTAAPRRAWPRSRSTRSASPGWSRPRLWCRLIGGASVRT